MRSNNKLLVNVALVFLLINVSCSTILPGNDPIVVRAEQIVPAATSTIDSFLKYEYDHRAELLVATPEVKKVADNLRVQAPKWIREARILTKVYKTNRTDQNKANLDTALAVLTEAMKSVNLIVIGK